MNITLMTDRPNNGYLAIVFEDTGMTISARCGIEDAFTGLTKAMSTLILEEVRGEEDEPDSSNLDNLDDYLKDLDRFTEVVQEHCYKLSNSILENTIIQVVISQLVKRGFSQQTAEIFAEGMAAQIRKNRKKEEDEDPAD